MVHVQALSRKDTALSSALSILWPHDGERSHFFSVLLPEVVRLASDLPSHFPEGIPHLGVHCSGVVWLSRRHVAVLVANMFLNRLPSRERTPPMPTPRTFERLLSCRDGMRDVQAGKLACVIHYFDRITANPPDGYIAYRRMHVQESVDWRGSSAAFTALTTIDGMWWLVLV